MLLHPSVCAEVYSVLLFRVLSLSSPPLQSILFMLLNERIQTSGLELAHFAECSNPWSSCSYYCTLVCLQCCAAFWLSVRLVGCHFSQNMYCFFSFFLLSPPFSTHPNPGTVWVTSVCRGFSLLGAWLESSTGQLPFHQMCWNHVSRPVSCMPDCHGHTQYSAPGNGVGSDGRCHLNIFGGREPTLSAAWDKHTQKKMECVSSFLVGFLANRQIWL